MKRVVLDLNYDYADILTLTAIGTGCGTNVFTFAVDLKKGAKLKMVKTEGGFTIEQEELRDEKID